MYFDYGNYDAKPVTRTQDQEVKLKNTADKTSSAAGDSVSYLLRTGQLRESAKLASRQDIEKIREFLAKFNYRADKAELDKLPQEERQQYEKLYLYSISKSNGMNEELDKQVAEWNKNHPNCKIRSQYDKPYVQASGGTQAKIDENYLPSKLKASDAELNKLPQEERQQYEKLFHYTNSKSHGMDKDLDKQIAEWNKNHPNCQIKSQYDKPYWRKA